MVKRGLLVTVSVLLTNTATASINIDVVEIDNSANPILDGFRTFDLIITTDQHWTTSALYLDLQQGSLYQDPWENWGFYPPDLAVLQTLEQNGTPKWIGVRYLFWRTLSHTGMARDRRRRSAGRLSVQCGRHHPVMGHAANVFR